VRSASASGRISWDRTWLPLRVQLRGQQGDLSALGRMCSEMCCAGRRSRCSHVLGLFQGKVPALVPRERRISVSSSSGSAGSEGAPRGCWKLTRALSWGGVCTCGWPSVAADMTMHGWVKPHSHERNCIPMSIFLD
jgi:hypothetical protein